MMMHGHYRICCRRLSREASKGVCSLEMRIRNVRGGEREGKSVPLPTLMPPRKTGTILRAVRDGTEDIWLPYPSESIER